jgi:hypothetical protein
MDLYQKSNSSSTRFSVAPDNYHKNKNTIRACTVPIINIRLNCAPFALYSDEESCDLLERLFVEVDLRFNEVNLSLFLVDLQLEERDSNKHNKPGEPNCSDSEL